MFAAYYRPFDVAFCMTNPQLGEDVHYRRATFLGAIEDKVGNLYPRLCEDFLKYDPEVLPAAQELVPLRLVCLYPRF